MALSIEKMLYTATIRPLKVMVCFLKILELATRFVHLKQKQCIVYIIRYVNNLFYSLMYKTLVCKPYKGKYLISNNVCN